MSRDNSRNVSVSSTHSRGQSPHPTSEISAAGVAYGGSSNSNNLSVLSNEWQVWSSQSVSPLAKEAIIHIADDGWTTTTTNTTPFKSHHDPGHQPRQRPDNLVNSNIMPTEGLQHGRPWLSQPARSEHYPSFSDANFPHPPSPPRLSATYTTPLHNAFEQMRLSPSKEDVHQGRFRGMPAEDDRGAYQMRPQMPSNLYPQMLPPPPFSQMPGTYNAYPPLEYGNYFVMPPPEPNTDYSFGFNHLGSSHFPVTHANPSNQNNLLYSGPMHYNGVPDARAQHMHHYEFSRPAPPPFFYQSSPHVLMTPVMPVPLSSGGTTHLANNSRQRRDLSLTNGPDISIPGSPRRFPFNRSPQIKVASQTPSHLPLQVNGRGFRRPNGAAAVATPRSALLEAFRSNNKDNRHWNLKEIAGHIVEFSGDQHGSRYIQQQLEEATLEERQLVFDEIVPESTDKLIQDVFGNYVIQKFFELGTPAQKDVLANAVEAKVVIFSLQIYGCRVVQKAIEYISEEQQTRIIRTLEQHIFACIKDAHGNHVIQKLVELVPPERLTFLRLISENIRDLSTHTYGCRVLQRCLEHLPEENTRLLLDAIHRYTIDLMKDQYGNYVIQFILQDGKERDKAKVISQIRGSLIRLAQHKYASNVCEKALICTDILSRHLLIEEIMDAPTEGENPILIMVKDQYANYVLQRALTVAEGEQRDLFFNQVKPLLATFRKSTSTYNKPLIAIERLMDKHFGKQTTSTEKLSAENTQTARM